MSRRQKPKKRNHQLTARVGAHALAQATALSIDAPRPWMTWRRIDGEALTRKGGVPHGVTVVWANQWFSVLGRPLAFADTEQTGWHLMIRNRPNTPVRSWHDLQRIKDELIGQHAVAVEVFPPRGEIVDQANLTHLWVVPPSRVLPELSLVRWIEESEAARGEVARI